MRRREFVRAASAGALGAGIAAGSGMLSGCSSIKLKQEHQPIDFDRKGKKPVGTMPMGEIGTTGIKVSKFGFGSHLRRDIIKNEKEREWMIREAYNLGVRLYDVYDKEQNCFQYEPMGRHLAPMINDVVISISILPWEDRTLREELERDLRLFGRDYIDMVRIHSYTPDDPSWGQWEELFKYKEQGKIRAVGIPIHRPGELEFPLKTYPIDYVIFPYNFYHNWTWLDWELKHKPFGEYDSMIAMLKEKGIGIVTMKAFASEWLIYPLIQLGKELDKTEEVSIPKAALHYIINSGLPIDTTLGGMYYPFHVYDNVDAFFNPKMTEAETNMLKKIRKQVKVIAQNHLPEHYRFLDRWATDSIDDSDLDRMT